MGVSVPAFLGLLLVGFFLLECLLCIFLWVGWRGMILNKFINYHYVYYDSYER